MGVGRSSALSNDDVSMTLAPGHGRIVVEHDGARACLAELAFAYPLKLIDPQRSFRELLAAVYVISYGGGLVAGDHVVLDVFVKQGTSLVLLTQGSTKVFKTRPGYSLTAAGKLRDSAAARDPVSRQAFTYSVERDSTLVLLPAPVTCFSRASYSQRQTFKLAPKANLVLLDWFTSGRMDRGESWDFDLYRSVNEIWLEERRLARDVTLLKQDGERSPGTRTSYADRAGPYACYAALFLYGPAAAPLVTFYNEAFLAVKQYRQNAPYSMLWSVSSFPDDPSGAIVRCAGADTESVKDWLCETLKAAGIEQLIGEDLWKVAFW